MSLAHSENQNKLYGEHVCTFSRHKATLSFLWSHVCIHLNNFQYALLVLLSAPLFSPAHLYLLGTKQQTNTVFVQWVYKSLVTENICLLQSFTELREAEGLANSLWVCHLSHYT